MIEFTTDLALWQLALLSLLSLAVGLLGGFVGLALGTMRLPALLLMGVNPQFAAGTNILVSALSAVAGGYRHVKEGRIDWGGGVAVGGSVVSWRLSGWVLCW